MQLTETRPRGRFVLALGGETAQGSRTPDFAANLEVCRSTVGPASIHSSAHHEALRRYLRPIRVERRADRQTMRRLFTNSNNLVAA
jgi:hypothetical protein